jgi:ribosomal protein S18 acetylase RimI-like enzyme
MLNPNKNLLIRRATAADLPSLVALNRDAYPDLIQDEVVWTEQQLSAHLDVFPQGQLVAEDSAFRCVGAISTLILRGSIDPLAPHTWVGITDGGYFSGHDPEGDTLYLADIYVGPAFWGQGVGSALYRALRDLCLDLRLRRVVAGGRLWGYTDVADHMSAHEYVAKVTAGELHDRVLVSQLRAGFRVRGLLPGYLHDWRSRHWATLLEWMNPDDPRNQQEFAAIAAKTLPAYW